MGTISNLWAKLQLSKNPTQPQGGQIVQAKVSQRNAILASPQPTSPKLKTLPELEAELAQNNQAQSTGLQVSQTREINPPKKKISWIKNLVIVGIVLGIPATIVTVANLPVAFIRQSIAKTAPALLIPTYLSLEENFKQSVIALESARTLILQPTSAKDIDRGRERLAEAKERINSIPAWFIDEWDRYYTHYRWYYYDWRFSPAGFQRARSEIGELEARAFQEANALNTLTEVISTLDQAKLQYQQSKTDADKRLRVTQWRTALDQLNAIPSTTLAGKQAQQKLATFERDFQEIVGLIAGNQRINSLISTAREYSKRAADMGRNPPHSAERWRQIKEFWREAIAELEKIPESDVVGYTQARSMIAEYKLQLAEVDRRMSDEQNSLQAYESAQDQVTKLIENAERLDRLQMTARLRQIMRDLDKVSNGTTSYLKAQELKVYTKNFMEKVQAGTKAEPLKPN